jgi:hypothetical protein
MRYDVAIVPHSNLASATIESVATPLAAMQRHAEIAHQLRESGWCVARRTA